MFQMSLFEKPRKTRQSRFGGETFDARRDGQRLMRQLDAVFEAMKDERWHTLPEIRAKACAIMGRPALDSAVSARIRDLRKPAFGAYRVEQRRAAGGTYEYRLLLPTVGYA